jgi:hypothetical protein
MQILTGAPVTAFRESGLSWGAHLSADGAGLHSAAAQRLSVSADAGVERDLGPNLRVLPILRLGRTLLLLERAVSTWVVWHDSQESRPIPVTLEGLVAVALVAASPSFVFWSRQGIFVTDPDTAMGGADALAGHLLAAQWRGTAPALGCAGGWPGTLCQAAGRLGGGTFGPAAALWAWLAGPSWPDVSWGRPCRVRWLPSCFLCCRCFGSTCKVGEPGGLGDNLTHSYYGVDNLAVGANLLSRLAQFVQVLRGDQFWYLGTVLATPSGAVGGAGG